MNELTEERVYKKLINVFLDRIPVLTKYGSNDLECKLFRKGETFQTSDDEYQILETGIFFKSPGGMWLKYCDLHEVNFLIPKDYKDMEIFYQNLVFASGIRKALPK